MNWLDFEVKGQVHRKAKYALWEAFSLRNTQTYFKETNYTVFQKKNIHSYYWFKLRNSCLILIIFDIKIPHII